MNSQPNIPIYAFIKRDLKNQIESGELPVGARVPSEFELAKRYGVSRNPTRQALRDLELEGYLVRSPGRGSFVAPAAQRQRLLNVNGWQTLALGCPVLEFRYTRTVIQGFIQRAAEQSFHTMIYFLRFSGEAEFEFLADIRNSGICGMAFWLQHTAEPILDLLRKFRKASFPFVLIDRYVRDLDTDFVVTDNDDAGYQLARTLIGRGHRSIGYVSSLMDNTTSEDRLAGYHRAIEEAQLPIARDLMGVFDQPEEPNSSVVHRIMAHRRHPTAFVCSDDGIAGNLLDELNLLGFSVPADVEIATVDDNDLAAAVEIPLITASQCAADMGSQSADILLTRIANPAAPLQQRFLKAALNVPDGLPARSAVGL